ncbi:MAG: hypothetical protein COA79_01115 [Planctomycetota bacterium]|nr:MAG: hypothetical protein COA79_01115 [Planctomycetota bacterium]
MKQNKPYYLQLTVLLFSLFIYGCGSSSSSDGGGGGIPPTIDPNGGPVFKIDIGSDSSSKKQKTNSFLKNNAESVQAYSTDGSLIGSAEKVDNNLWQIQLPNTNDVIIKSVISNITGGKIRLELLLSSTQLNLMESAPKINNAVELNDKTTQVVALAYLLSHLEGAQLETESNIATLLSDAQNLFDDINNNSYLKDTLDSINPSSSATIAVDEAAIYIKEVYTFISLLDSVNSRISGIESGTITSDLVGIASSQFAANGAFDLVSITANLDINDLNAMVNQINSDLLDVEILSGNIKLTSKSDSSINQSVSFPITSNDVNEIQSFFGASTNSPPTITSTAPTSAVQDVLYTYTIVTSDNDGDPVTLTAISLPTWLTLNSNIISGTPTSANNGNFNVIIEATDNISSPPDQEVFTISVTATASDNASPVIISGPSIASTVGSPYSYTIFATDSDNDTLTYSASTIPAWLSFNTSTHELSGTPVLGDIGVYSIQLDVNDGKNVASDNFTITVSDVSSNASPTFSSQSNTTAHQDTAFSLTINATDAENDTVTLASKQIPSWLTFSATTGVLSGTPSSSDAGTTTIIITASDGINLPVTELQFTITVNTIPSITSTPIEVAIAKSAYIYNITAVDNDGDTPIISTTTKPAWLTFTATGNVLSGIPAESDIGVHDIELSVTDSKSVATGKQIFQILVLNDIFIGTVDSTEITDSQIVKFGTDNIVLGIAPRDSSNTSLTLKILIDGSEQTLTNNTFTLTPIKSSYTVIFKAIDSTQVERTLTVTLEQDTAHLVEISFTGETAITGGYRKITGPITFTAAFQGVGTDTIISRTIQLDDVPQALDSSNQYIMDPTTISTGAHKIKATISYTDSNSKTQTSSKTIDFNLIDNILPTQTIKIDSLVITSDTSLVLHSGTKVTVTTENHDDADNDSITKGLYINDVLNADLTSYVVDIAVSETLKIKTYLKDPYGESVAYTLTFTSATTNGGIPITLSASGTLLTSTTTFRDKVNGLSNIATVTVNLGTDPEGDALSSVQWYINSVLKSGETNTTLLLDLSNYGGTTVNVEARVTDDFTSSPTTTNASMNLVVDLDTVPSFSSATLDGVSINLSASIAVDHAVAINKIYIPTASDPEGDTFTFKYNLSSLTTSGTQYSIPYNTLNNSTFTVNIVQFDLNVATNSHNVTANNIVPTPIIIGNTSHIDLNGNYSLIVRPGEDLEGDKLTTVVSLNGNAIAGVVVNNEIQYIINLTALGNTTAVFSATNSDDNGATPITTNFNVTVIQSIAPANIKATRGNAGVSLAWDSVTSASNYNIYYGTAQPITLGSTKIAGVTSAATISSLTNGTTYYFRVSANHTSSEGPLSSTDIVMTPHAPGDTLTIAVNAQNFVFKFIPANTFTQGSASTETGHETAEAPSHSVTISKGFWMMETEVNQIQWNAIITSAHPTISGSPSSFIGGTLPVEQVTWEDIMGTDGFINKFHLADSGTSLTSGLYMLPTEAQWESAYRSATTTRFHWGDDTSLTSISTYAWFSTNATSTTNPVASKTANAWGLRDMSGNVSEWCMDKAPSAYISSAVTDPTGPTTGVERIYRGGSWFDSGNKCRAAQRFQASKDIKGTNLGFRFIRIPLDTE